MIIRTMTTMMMMMMMMMMIKIIMKTMMMMIMTVRMMLMMFVRMDMQTVRCGQCQKNAKKIVFTCWPTAKRAAMYVAAPTPQPNTEKPKNANPLPATM